MDILWAEVEEVEGWYSFCQRIFLEYSDKYSWNDFIYFYTFWGLGSFGFGSGENIWFPLLNEN